jgi:hypothetical protein
MVETALSKLNDEWLVDAFRNGNWVMLLKISNVNVGCISRTGPIVLGK